MFCINVTMNKTIIVLTLLLYGSSVFGVFINPMEIEDAEQIEDNTERSRRPKMTSTLYKTVSKYYCAAEDIDDSHLIIYGTKAWSFSPQDVNMTLSYPTANTKMMSDQYGDYVITGFRVHLYIDGSSTHGCIDKGGIFQDSITLTFLSKNITKLWYQFWVYGVPKVWQSVPEASIFYYHMCQ